MKEVQEEGRLLSSLPLETLVSSVFSLKQKTITLTAGSAKQNSGQSPQKDSLETQVQLLFPSQCR